MDGTLEALRMRSHFPIPDSRFPIPDSRFPIPDSRFPIPDSPFSNYSDIDAVANSGNYTT
ncbi:hypothetical protein [Moorena sp. SIO3B2]|uniref:hypothetical protein n=1 Tax=Moorena sp. SIO3B2 TaxID=2607827 RepID=UPI0013C62448|nr:hypothetical protein [Moorena sp. SIO3B2]NEP35911.1 hypothetical protein [Moorena sp. SIO3B2]